MDISGLVEVINMIGPSGMMLIFAIGLLMQHREIQGLRARVDILSETFQKQCMEDARDSVRKDDVQYIKDTLDRLYELITRQTDKCGTTCLASLLARSERSARDLGV